MNADKDFTQEFLKNRHEASEKSRNSEVVKHNKIVLKQAAVKARWLVNDAHWVTYMTWIQADIEELETMAAAARATLENPKVLDHQGLLLAKAVLLEAKARIDSLNIAISYPHQILAGKKDLDEREKDLHLEKE